MIFLGVYVALFGMVALAAYVAGPLKPDLSPRAEVALIIGLALVAPVAALYFFGLGVARATEFLYGGFAELYRSFFPRKVELPTAKVHKQP